MSPSPQFLNKINHNHSSSFLSSKIKVTLTGESSSGNIHPSKIANSKRRRWKYMYDGKGKAKEGADDPFLFFPSHSPTTPRATITIPSQGKPNENGG
jgi:hypothetical protein